MKILRKTDVIYLKRKLRTCRIQIQVEIVWFFGKETENFIFSIFYQRVKMVFFNFSKFHNFFSQNSFPGTKQILKQTKSWILVTPVIKVWKCQTVLGCSGPKGPPSVGIGLSVLHAGRGGPKFKLWTLKLIPNFLFLGNFEEKG